MPTTFANSINSNPIYADRAEHDAAGNTISSTYATKLELPTIGTIDLTPTPSEPDPTPSEPDPTPSEPSGEEQATCPECGGTGTIWDEPSQENLTCPTCGGTGLAPGDAPAAGMCPGCGGTGYVTTGENELGEPIQEVCPQCGGTGEYYGD